MVPCSPLVWSYQHADGACSRNAVMESPPQMLRGWSLIKLDSETKGCWNRVPDMTEHGCYANLPKSSDDAAKKVNQKDRKVAAASAG